MKYGFLCLLVFSTALADEIPRPNILLLVAEDMSARVGAFGDDVAVTPNIDALANEGVRFTNTFTTAGVCSPSRAALILGMYQTSVGAQHMRTSSYEGATYLTVPPPGVNAFPELLRRAGYYTYASSKLDYQFSGVSAGTGPASIWDYEGAEPTWRRRSEGQPFFGMHHFDETHESRLFDDHPGQTAPDKLRNPVSPEDVSVPPVYPDTPVVRATIAQHYNNIQGMDKRVGDILRQLEDDGLAEDTIVIWTSDHGDGLPRFKREIYDTGIKVPMVIRWPDAIRPSSYSNGDLDEQLISFIDLAPTILAFAGLSVPDNMQGRAISGDNQRRYVVAAKDRLDEHPNRERAIRDERFKYILNLEPGLPGAQAIAYRDQLGIMAELWTLSANDLLDDTQQAWFLPRPAEALYDTHNDPFETQNLIDDANYADVALRMRKAMRDWQESTPDLGDIPEAELAERFWPGSVQPVTPAPVVTIDRDGIASIACKDPDASITYQIDEGPRQLYSVPLQIEAGATVTAMATRYGWAESEAASAGY